MNARLIVLGVLACALARAQVAPAPAVSSPAKPKAPVTAAASATTPADAPKEETITLNAFEVRVDADDSYGALESNSITRFRTNLETLPVDASVFTKTFMDDVAVTTVEDMLVQYAGAYAGSADPGGSATTGELGDRNGSPEFSIGGLRLSVRRDGFVAMAPNTKGPVGATDAFSTERAELIHGPQSLLYGGAGAGGIANIVSKQGHFNQRRASLRYTIDQFGSKRAELDYNYGTRNIAARVALLRTNRASYRYLLDGHADGAYAQLAFRLPFHTTVRVWGQTVDAKQNNSFGLANVNSFLSATDARRGKRPKFLIATGQADDIRIGDVPINMGNVDSFASQWASSYIDDRFAGASVETVVAPWLTTQIAAAYDDAIEYANSPGKALLQPGATGNPFPGEAAVSVTTTGNTTSLQPVRKKAFRYSAVVEKGFFQNRFTTQTILGAETVTQNSANMNSGYFRADSNFVADTSGAPATNYGRTFMPVQVFSLDGGIPKYPLFAPASEHVTLNGVNYVLEPLRLPNASLVSATNPLGLVGGTGTYTRAKIFTRAYYLAHVSGLFDNRLKFLGGARYDDQTGTQQGITSTGLKNAVYSATKLSYNLGLNYTVLPRTNVFVSSSTAFDPDTSTTDFFGNPLRSSVSRGLQAGVRYSSPNRGLSASLTYQKATGTNQTQLVDQTWLDAINPAGINGRYSTFAGTDRWVNVDRQSQSVRLQVDLNRGRNWRASFRGSFNDGRVASDGVFAQVYNDQFYTRNGGVTYADGTPLLVSPTGTGAATTPLTLAMINDPTNRYYANPDPDSGRITNTNLISVLTATSARGSAATGVNGLPISAIQYNWSDPFGHQGELAPVAGSQYSPGPRFTFSFFNNYSVTEGWLRGLAIGTGVSVAYKNHAYYYTVGGTSATRGQRVPFLMPTPAVFEYSLSYSRKLGRRYAFRTQLNVKNAFNHYFYAITPTASNGTFENARLINEPRRFIWTNTVSF